MAAIYKGMPNLAAQRMLSAPNATRPVPRCIRLCKGHNETASHQPLPSSGPCSSLQQQLAARWLHGLQCVCSRIAFLLVCKHTLGYMLVPGRQS